MTKITLINDIAREISSIVTKSMSEFCCNILFDINTTRYKNKYFPMLLETFPESIDQDIKFCAYDKYNKLDDGYIYFYPYNDKSRFGMYADPELIYKFDKKWYDKANKVGHDLIADISKVLTDMFKTHKPNHV